MFFTGDKYGRRKGPATVGILLAAVAFCALPQVARAQTSKEAETLLSNWVSDFTSPNYKDVVDAVTRFKNNALDEALALLESAKKKNPQLPPARVMLAQLIFAAGNVQNNVAIARTHLERAVVDEPEDPEAYLFFADLAFQQRLITDADVLFQKAAILVAKYDRNPKRKRNMQMRANAGLAAVAEAREQWIEAEKYLRAWLAEDPQNVGGRARLARVLFELGEKEKDAAKKQQLFSDAYQLYVKIYDENKDGIRPEINMALLYEQAGMRDHARQLMKLASERDPSNVNTRLAVAQWSLEAGEIDMAQQNADAALKLQPRALQGRLLLGMTARYKKDLATAEQMFRDAHFLSPTNFAAINQLALTLIESGDPNKQRDALELSQLNARANSEGNSPAKREAIITLAWVYYKLGQLADAERTIMAVLNAGSVSPESAYYAARVFSERGQPEAALQILQPMADNKLVFPYRAEAEQLLAELKRNAGKPVAPPAAGAAPAAAPGS